MNKTMTNYEISQIVEYANRPESLFNKPDARISVTCAWRMRRNLNRLVPINEMFEAARSNLMSFYMPEKYSYERDGERYVKDEYIPEYTAQMNELYNQLNNVDIDMVTINEITPNPNSFEVTYNDLDMLSFMILDEEDDEGEEGFAEDAEVMPTIVDDGAEML